MNPWIVESTQRLIGKESSLQTSHVSLALLVFVFRGGQVATKGFFLLTQSELDSTKTLCLA